MHTNEEQQRNMIACALLRGYGSREETAREEIEQLLKLRALQNRTLSEQASECCSVINLPAFYEELFTAAELCLAGSGYKIDIIQCAVYNERLYSKINQRALSHAAMNLLANALQYSVDKTARISCQSSGGRVLLRIENKGALKWDEVRSGLEKSGSGLRSAQDVILDHGGQLILAQRYDFCCAAIILPECDCQEPQAVPVNCADLLFDRTSPVHVGLAGLIMV